MATPIDPADHRWYQRAVFYEVLVRGFYDSTNDGTGDLTGLTQKLDYLEWLGIAFSKTGGGSPHFSSAAVTRTCGALACWATAAAPTMGTRATAPQTRILRIEHLSLPLWRNERRRRRNFCRYNGRPMSQDPARDAVSRGDWQQAYDLLVEADARSPLTAPDLALLADMAYAAGHLDVTIAAWERAYAQGLAAGDRLAAAGAAVKVALHFILDTALMAPVRGWARRCEQLLEGLDETPVHAWLAVIRNYERLLSGDFEEARVWARRAIDTGAKCAPAAAAIGRVAEARSLILEGDVARGLGLLDEAGTAAVSGELDPLSTGIVYCEVVCALQALAQYDLADEWTEAMERWRQGQPVGSVHGRCRAPPRRDPPPAGIVRRSGAGSAPGLRGAAPLSASGARVAADRDRPHPPPERRRPGRGGGIRRRPRRRVGPPTRARPRAPGQG